jgi:hypothetical protein
LDLFSTGGKTLKQIIQVDGLQTFLLIKEQFHATVAPTLRISPGSIPFALPPLASRKNSVVIWRTQDGFYLYTCHSHVERTKRPSSEKLIE